MLQVTDSGRRGRKREGKREGERAKGRMVWRLITKSIDARYFLVHFTYFVLSWLKFNQEPYCARWVMRGLYLEPSVLQRKLSLSFSLSLSLSLSLAQLSRIFYVLCSFFCINSCSSLVSLSLSLSCFVMEGRVVASDGIFVPAGISIFYFFCDQSKK